MSSLFPTRCVDLILHFFVILVDWTEPANKWPMMKQIALELLRAEMQDKPLSKMRSYFAVSLFVLFMSLPCAFLPCGLTFESLTFFLTHSRYKIRETCYWLHVVCSKHRILVSFYVETLSTILIMDYYMYCIEYPAMRKPLTSQRPIKDRTAPMMAA